jgi:GNAT superfamily N-acetyltransferase
VAALWRGYCAALGSAVPDTVTDGVWHRILTPDEPVGCLLACRPEGEPVGLANYVLHPNTWSLQMICYLEDLFVAAEARGSGAGRALIDSLVALGKERGWRRVYWHTQEKNYALARCMTAHLPDGLHPLRHRPLTVGQWLDRAPKGRNEPTYWWRHHDAYDKR